MSAGLGNINQCSQQGVWSGISVGVACMGGVGGACSGSIGSSPRKWRVGELEFEALMRMLDNKVRSDRSSDPPNLSACNTETLRGDGKNYQVENSVIKFIPSILHLKTDGSKFNFVLDSSSPIAVQLTVKIIFPRAPDPLLRRT